LNTDQLELIEGLLHHHDRHERLSAIVERTRHSPRFSASDQAPRYRVAGCSSAVWLICEIAAGRCHFRSDADSPVVRGLVALLTDFHNDSTPAEIIHNEADPSNFSILTAALLRPADMDLRLYQTQFGTSLLPT